MNNLESLFWSSQGATKQSFIPLLNTFYWLNGRDFNTPSLELYIPFNCCKCKGGSRPTGARGSPLFLDQTEARRAEINFFGDHSHDNPPSPPPPIPLSHGLDPPLKCTKPKRFLNYFTFYKPKWKISLSFHILQGMKFLLFHIPEA